LDRSWIDGEVRDAVVGGVDDEADDRLVMGW